MSHRIPQINSLIQGELSSLLVKGGVIPGQEIITITKVATSRDLGQSRVYVSVLPADKRENIVRMLNNKSGQLRHALQQTLVLRRVPRLIFSADTTGEKAAYIESLIDKIHTEE